MKKTFWGFIWSCFLRINGLMLGLIALVIAVILWRFPFDQNISLGVAIPILVVFIILITTFGNAAYETFKSNRNILPVVLVGRKPSIDIPGAVLLCLLEPSELFSYDILVSFYYVGDENFEQLMGIGTVINIQEDKKIQVIMSYVFKGYNEQVNKLLQNDSSMLKKTKVKPNIPKGYLEQISHGGLNK